MKCEFCRPHAKPSKHRLCHEGQRLFDAYRAAGEKWAELSGMMDPPVVALEKATNAKNEARKAYRAHIDGGT